MKRQFKIRSKTRRGMAILMVLLLLSLTLGLSYAALRSLRMVSTIQRNSDRQGAARQAAITGLSIALKKMQCSDWSGVGTSLSGSLGSYESYSATYTAGDSRLESSNSYQPYRVTVLSTGSAIDPNNSASVAKYRVRAVVQLIPRKLADEPSDWTTLMNYTVFQRTFGAFELDLPARIGGPVRMQALLALAQSYNWDSTSRKQYLKDLNSMYAAGVGDYRPFSGPVSLPTSWQFFTDAMTVLNSYLGVSTTDWTFDSISSLSFPSSASTYRLYPGGKSYTIPQLPQNISGATYQADPDTNPAGIFVRSGSLYMGEGATVSGTVFTTANSGGQVYVSGSSVTMAPVNLWALHGGTVPVQLPAAVISDSFIVGPDSSINITGVVVAADSFQVLSDNDSDITVTHKGKLIAQSFYFPSRTNWSNITSTKWSNQYTAFKNQSAYKYFPLWMAKYHSLNYVPKITIMPDANSIQYHWHNPQNTIYTTHPDDDDGLRWDLIAWTENL